MTITFDETKHPRAAAGTFTNKEQTAPELGLAVAKPTPAMDAYDAESRISWRAENRTLVAAATAMKELARNADLGVAQVELEYVTDIDASSVDVHRFLDADGNEIDEDANYAVFAELREGIEALGDHFDEYEKAKDSTEFVRAPGSDRLLLDVAETPAADWRVDSDLADLTESIRLIEAQRAAVAKQGIAAALRDEFEDAKTVRFWVNSSGYWNLHSVADADGDEIIDGLRVDQKLLYRVNGYAALVDWDDDQAVRRSDYDVADVEFDIA